MNGTTRCPHCDTRFKISDEQLGAHQGMVRCGHCMQAFDARPELIAEPYVQQHDSASNEAAAHAEIAVEPHGHGVPEEADHQERVAHQQGDHGIGALVEHTAREEGERVDLDGHQAEPAVPVDSEIDPVPLPEERAAETVPPQTETSDALDFSHLSEAVVEQERIPHVVHPGENIHAELATHAEPVVQDTLEDDAPFSAGMSDTDASGEVKSRRIWPWVVGIVSALLLLLAQSAYFFRVNLAAHMPALKPLLSSYCSLLGCSVPLPKNAELISIESSGLEADPDHENQIAFNALLRNRAGYTLAFPVLALTLNDDQDKPLARRLFRPADYLPASESETTGFLENREVSINLRLNTPDIRPVGYRLELFYSRN